MDTSWPQQGLGPWRQQQNMQHGRVQSVWAGPLTGGERVPAGEGGAPSGGGGGGGGAQRWASRSLVLTSLLATATSTKRSG